MKIVQNNSRISILGLVKFLAALAIVLYHTMPYDGYWRQSYLLVEFFFFITGYFTFKHFQKDQKAIQHDDIEAKSIKALKYTAKKFLAFLPFVIIASIMIHAGPIYTFLTTGNITQELAEAIIAIPLDSLFLNTVSPTPGWAIWFLSAMFIIFPLFCLICQVRKKKILFLLAALAVIVYYTLFFENRTRYEESIIRAFFGMLTGIPIYMLAEKLRSISLKRSHKILLQIAESSLFLLAIISLYPAANSPLLPAYTLCSLAIFGSYLTILFSRQTPLSRLSSPTFDFLEKISMVIFLVHMPIMSLVKLFKPYFWGAKYCIFILIVSILASIFLFCLWEYIKSQRQKRRQQAQLSLPSPQSSD